MFVARSRRRPLALPAEFTKRLICSLETPPSQKLREVYTCQPPPPSNDFETLPPVDWNVRWYERRKEKPLYKPPSSLDCYGKKPLRSPLLFDFKYSYTQVCPLVRPIGLRGPLHSPFGPGRLDREWTGICAPAVGSGSTLGVEQPELEERRKKLRERLLGEPLTREERKFLIEKFQRKSTRRSVHLGRDGLTHNMLKIIHDHWKYAVAVRIQCLGVSTVDMKNVCNQLEDKTLGKVIFRQGGQVILFRGRNYRRAPQIPLMLWKPTEPIYPRIIQLTIKGLSIGETKELRQRGLAVPVLTKLVKNGYYGDLVPMVQNAFLTDDLVRIDGMGLERSDLKKIGCKLRYMVPCTLVTFQNDQIVTWRGKNYRPISYQGFPARDKLLYEDEDSCASKEEEFYSGDDE